MRLPVVFVIWLKLEAFNEDVRNLDRRLLG